MIERHQETLTIDTVLDRLIDIHEFDDMAILRFVNKAFASPRPLKIENIQNRRLIVADYRKQLEKLRELPVIEQRTLEWYELRKNLITASDFAQALGEGKFGTQKQFFQKKCGFEKDVFNYNTPPLKWGTMYEPVAGDIYCRRNNVELFEFGILKHPTIDFIGASPDGITSNGIMLEIKCPFKRKITGEIPTQYYYQIQGQLEVCELEECDYLECEFTETMDVEDFQAFENEKGVIIEYATDGTTPPQYTYSPIWSGVNTDMDSVDEWITTNMNTTQTNIVLHYWKLTTLNVVRVYKDDAFVQEKIDMLKDVWDKVLQYQNDKDLYLKEVGSSSVSRGNSLTIDLGMKGGRQVTPKISGYSFIGDE